jgi:hypothetical protein
LNIFKSKEFFYIIMDKPKNRLKNIYFNLKKIFYTNSNKQNSNKQNSNKQKIEILEYILNPYMI